MLGNRMSETHLSAIMNQWDEGDRDSRKALEAKYVLKVKQTEEKKTEEPEPSPGVMTTEDSAKKKFRGDKSITRGREK